MSRCLRRPVLVALVALAVLAPTGSAHARSARSREKAARAPAPPPAVEAAAPAVAAPEEPWAEPPVPWLTRVVAPSSGADLTLEALVAELAKADVAFLGEAHDDETTHRLELEIYRRLVDAREGRVVLALEMFSRDAQGVLDQYLAGSIDEAKFLAESHPWGNYRLSYRPLVELARERGLPVVASNAASSVQRKVAFGGEEAWKALTDEEKGLVATELFPPTEEYWRRVENATRSHRGMLPTEGARVYSTQSLWDNTMGESVARALAAHPGWLVLHVNGGFHSEWHDGTVRQVALRAPQATIRTVAITPVRQPEAVDASSLPNSADWIAHVTSRDKDASLGTFTVAVGGELRYRVRVPRSASAAAPVPLLIWLPDDGPPAADELARWKRVLGDEAAVAVIEQQWREQQDDMSLGGRWTWPDDFREDVARAAGGVANAWAYLCRNFPVSPERVVVAGEGVGASVAVTAHLYGDEMTGRVLAIAPRKNGELRDLSLPMGEDRVGPPPSRPLTVLSPAADREWWDEETADYREVGLAASVDAWPDDPWEQARREEDAVREALGLAARERDGSGRAHVVLQDDTPLARSWARTVAAAHEARTGDTVAVLTAAAASALGDRLAGSTELPTRATASLFASGELLPRASGPFGGTTLIVLGKDLTETEREAWQQLEKDDPLNAKSRFHRLRTATLDGERSLPVVLDELLSQHRTNVLIVPATFAASPDFMRSLRAAARPHQDDMTLEYRPGLGAALAHAGEDDTPAS